MSKKRRKCPVVDLAGRKFRLRKRLANLAAVVAFETGAVGVAPVLRLRAEEIGAYEVWIVDPQD